MGSCFLFVLKICSSQRYTSQTPTYCKQEYSHRMLFLLCCTLHVSFLTRHDNWTPSCPWHNVVLSLWQQSGSQAFQIAEAQRNSSSCVVALPGVRRQKMGDGSVCKLWPRSAEAQGSAPSPELKAPSLPCQPCHWCSLAKIPAVSLVFYCPHLLKRDFLSSL